MNGDNVAIRLHDHTSISEMLLILLMTKGRSTNHETFLGRRREIVLGDVIVDGLIFR